MYLQSLVQEANEKGYNTSEVYDELQATLQDVKKCASTAVQLVTTKPKTRYSNVDVRDVKEFLSQVEGLPCKLPEADVLKVRGREGEGGGEREERGVGGEERGMMKSFNINHLSGLKGNMLITTSDKLTSSYTT